MPCIASLLPLCFSAVILPYSCMAVLLSTSTHTGCPRPHTSAAPTQEELLAADLASAVRQMAATGRYGELLLLADTCQVRRGCMSRHHDSSAGCRG